MNCWILITLGWITLTDNICFWDSCCFIFVSVKRGDSREHTVCFLYFTKAHCRYDYTHIKVDPLQFQTIPYSYLYNQNCRSIFRSVRCHKENMTDHTGAGFNPRGFNFDFSDIHIGYSYNNESLHYSMILCFYVCLFTSINGSKHVLRFDTMARFSLWIEHIWKLKNNVCRSETDMWSWPLNTHTHTQNMSVHLWFMIYVRVTV